MKRIKEKDIRAMELFCIIAALAADILCIFYLLNIIQLHWALSLIQMLAVLLHAALALLGFVQKKTVPAAGAAVLSLGYLLSLIYHNLGV